MDCYRMAMNDIAFIDPQSQVLHWKRPNDIQGKKFPTKIRI